MKDGDPGARLARSWVAIYTHGLDDVDAARRRLEIESDIYEHHRALGNRGILGRVLRGIPADVWWRIRTLRNCAGETGRSPHMYTAPHRTPWIVLLAVHIALTFTGGVPQDASTITTALALTAYAGSAVALIGVMVQRRRFVAGSWIVAAGLTPTLASVTGPLVLVSGLWTANLVFSRQTAELGAEVISARRSSLFARRWSTWLVSSAVLFSTGFIGLAVHNVTIARLTWGPAAIAALIGIWLLSTGRDGSETGRVRAGQRERWWRIGAMVIATVFGAVGVSGLLDTEERDVGAAIAVGLAILVVAGLIVRRSNRKVGSRMVGVGVLPGVSAIVLFWFPPALLLGLLSIAVMVASFSDSTRDAGASPLPASPSPPDSPPHAAQA